MKEMLTIAEAAGVLDMRPRKLRDLACRGTIPASRIGRRWRIPRDWVEQALRGQIDTQNAI